MPDEIGFSEGEKKIVPPIQDIEEKEMRDKAIKGLEQRQAKQQVAAEAGITQPPAAVESVPKEVPYLFFHYGAKAIQCPKFEADDAECNVLAKHLSILIGAQNSKVWSLIVIILILFGKLVACWDAIKNWRKPKSEKNIEPSEIKVTETL